MSQDFLPQARTDMPANGWVNGWIGRMPARIQPLALLSRWDRPIGMWLLLLPGWWAIALFLSPASPTFWSLHLKFLLGAILMRGAGCTWNDVCDRDFDAHVERTRSRPLPSGIITVRGAMFWMVAQTLLAALILLTMPRFAIKIGVSSLILVALYPLMKRATWWPQAFLGVTFNWGVLLGSAAAIGKLPVASILLYAGAIAWTIGYDTIYADQDREDDALIGVRSTARLFGVHQPILVGICYGVALWLWALTGYAASEGAGYAAGLAIVAVLLFRQLWLWHPGDGAQALAMFKSNRAVGCILWLAIIAGRWG